MVLGEMWSMAMPPRRLPRTPAEAAAIHTNDWSWPDPDGYCDCFPASATIASLATSAMDAPRLPRRRKKLRIAMEVEDSGRKAIANQEMACKRAAERAMLINY